MAITSRLVFLPSLGFQGPSGAPWSRAERRVISCPRCWENPGSSALCASTAHGQEGGHGSLWRESFLSEATGAPILGWSFYHGHSLMESEEVLGRGGLEIPRPTHVFANYTHTEVSPEPSEATLHPASLSQALPCAASPTALPVCPLLALPSCTSHPACPPPCIHASLTPLSPPPPESPFL